MFDLGFKQVVINDGTDPVIKDLGNGYVEVEGFGTFKGGGSSSKYDKDPVEKTLGTTAITGEPVGWNIDQVWEIKVHVSSGEGAGGSVGEIRDSGEILYFQVGKIKKLGNVDPPADFDGILQQNVTDSSVMLDYAPGVFMFKPGYEGYTVDKVYATKLYDPAIANFDDRYSTPEDLTASVTEGNFGFGYPAQIEESVRMNTPHTVNPYGIHVGGNYAVEFDNDSVGTPGKIRYTEITWFTKEDHLEGMEPHNMLGYGDANTEATYSDRKYSVYIQSTGADGAVKNAVEIGLLKSI